MSTADDLTLLEAAKQGDRSALEQLLRSQRAGVLRFALRVCITYEDAEDATQETLLSLARTVEAFRGASALSTWLFTVTKNHCTKYIRKRIRLVLRELGDNDLGGSGGPEEADDEMAHEQLRARMAEVMASMDERSREVLVLRDVDGLTAPQAAEQLGITVEALKSRLHRARGDLRGRLLSALR